MAVQNLQKEIDAALEEENVRWKQRAKQDWLKDRDRNTKFFHKRANQRRRVNEIRQVKRGDGRLAISFEEISETFCLHNQELFNTSNPVNLDECLAKVELKVDEQVNRILSREFTAEEIKSALFQMNHLGSLGPNGFSAVFYQKHWDTVGGDVTRAALEFLNAAGDISSINNIFLVMIPKVKKPLSVNEYRPISLCNVIYKVISKALANRLKLILPQIISHTQSAFVPGRLILDNVIVAFEAMHSMNTKLKGKQGYMSLKLDMSKVYDRVEWVFLR